MTARAKRSIGGTTLSVDTKLTSIDGQEVLHAKVLRDRKITLDLKRAEHYVDLPVFPGERRVAEGHVQLLVDEMRRGNFNATVVQLATALLTSDGRTYKVNGQHTAWAVALMQQFEEGYSIEVRELHYEVDTIDQLRTLYASFDRGRPRTGTHLAKVHVAGTPQTEGIPDRVVQNLIAGMRLWQTANPKSKECRLTPEQIATLIRQHYPETFRLVALFATTHQEAKTIMRKAPVMAAMLATYDKLPSRAHEFWEPVATGLGFTSKSDARYRLRDLLQTSGLRSDTQTRNGVDAESMYRLCILAWDKWRTDAPVEILRTPKTRTKPK